MWRSSALKVIAATAIFAALHSALASRRAKQAATKTFSPRGRNALYRPFYLAQSAVATAILVAYIRSLPSRTLYEVRGPLALPLRIGQLGALVWATASAYHVGFTEILGIRGLIEWTLGDVIIAAEPEAQGPAANPNLSLRIQGPFRLSRHPLNLAPLPVIWLNPRMTTNLLAFNIAATLYLIAGSSHEESRLRDAYSDAYARYQTSGVPFLLPKSADLLTER